MYFWYIMRYSGNKRNLYRPIYIATVRLWLDSRRNCVNIGLRADEHSIVASFRQLRTLDDVAQLLEISPKTLIYYLYRLTPEKKYTHFAINKRNGDKRQIAEPIKGLKIIQQKLLTVLSYVYKPRPSVHGFTSGRSIATNAQQHEGQRYVFNIDIENFFPSVNFGRVRGMFMSSPYNLAAEASTVLAKICCEYNQLLQGAPTSPIVSNMICYRLDGDLQRLANRRRCIYSRYADDITFSTSNEKFPKSLVYVHHTSESDTLLIGDELRDIIQSNGFTLNEQKTRLLHQSDCQMVTGLTVNEKVNVKRTYVRQIRAMLHAWRKFGPKLAHQEHFAKFNNNNRAPFRSEPSFGKIVKGKLNFLAMVRGNDDNLYRNLLIQYSRLNSHYTVQPLGLRPNHLKRLEDALFIVEFFEDIDNCFQGTGFFLEGFGLVTCEHVVRGVASAFKSINGNLTYPVNVILKDRRLDLAIANLDVPGIFHLVPSSGAPPRIGSQIKVAGYPGWAPGSSLWISSGFVTGYKKRDGRPRIVVSCPIGGGASGGPVLDQHGRVIGIISAGISNTDDSADSVTNEVIPLEELRFLRNSPTATFT